MNNIKFSSPKIYEWKPNLTKKKINITYRDKLLTILSCTNKQKIWLGYNQKKE